MSLRLFYFSTLSLLLTIACQRTPVSEVQRWNLELGDMPQEFKSAADTLDSAKETMDFSGHKTFIQAQQIQGIQIDGHDLHGLKNSKGQWVELTLKTPPRLGILESFSAQYLEKTLPHKEDSFLKKYPDWNVIDKKVIYFQNKPDEEFQLAYELIALNPGESDVVRFRFSRKSELLEKKSVAEHFVQGKARVFKGRPDVEPLDVENLPDLLGSGYLKGSRVHLVSDLTQQAYSDDHVFQFDPKDSLFNDVQAYFFADRAVLWFDEKLGLELESPIEVKVHVGFPQKTNTAFYYDFKIRLGDGDGLTYKNIPRDPTIVSHEVAHAFVKKLSGLPFEGEGGSLNEAFSDYFAAEITGHSQMAGYAYVPGPYKRNLDNTFNTSHLKGSMYNDSLVVSGSLWDVKTELGSEKSLKIATLTLMHLGPHGRLKDFPITLLKVAKDELKTDEYEKIENLMYQKRGWDKDLPQSKNLKENAI